MEMTENRSAIATIIDPRAWNERLPFYHSQDGLDGRNMSLRKADAILARLAPAPEKAVREAAHGPAKLVERLCTGDLCQELHPSNDGQHIRCDVARTIVGNFHTKADLVQAFNVLLAALAQPEAARVVSCVACEDRPTGDNNPCAVCGLATPAPRNANETEQDEGRGNPPPVMRGSAELDGITIKGKVVTAEFATPIDAGKFFVFMQDWLATGTAALATQPAAGSEG